MNYFKLRKQNETNEQILRELMNLEENKKCFDCSSKVITYVNLSINTFICTECGGLLREINHRVKNISMSTFTPEEIKMLQNGGNKKAKAIWLAKWNENFSEPNHDTDDIKLIKEYIRNKYINRKWFKIPNESELYIPVLRISTKSDSNANINYKYNISKSFNEIEYIERQKYKSKTKNTKEKTSRKSLDNKENRYLSVNGYYYNPYILLDDEQDCFELDYTSNVTPSVDIFSNSIIKNNDYSNSNNPFLVNNLNNYKYSSNSINNNTTININTNKNHVSENYPVYAPRSSSLLNKTLIDKVCKTNSNCLIDNKKVYYYKKKTHHYSTQY